MKYHKGQKVVISNPDKEYEMYKGKIITLTAIASIEVPMWHCEENPLIWEEDQLSPLEKTWETLQAGDIVIDEEGYERKVLARVDELIALSDENYHDIFNSLRVVSRIKKFGYTIKQDKPQEETIEILGKRYKKDDVVKKLEGLEI